MSSPSRWWLRKKNKDWCLVLLSKSLWRVTGESDDDHAWDAMVEIVFSIVLIIDDLTVVKTTISRKELSDMRDISLIFTTKNQTESLVEIDNQVLLIREVGRITILICSIYAYADVRPMDKTWHLHLHSAYRSTVRVRIIAAAERFRKNGAGCNEG